MELLRCPFCGSNKIADRIRYIECLECESKGGFSEYEVQAKKNWNYRHSPWISVKDEKIPLHEDILITDLKRVDKTYLSDYSGMLIDDYYVNFDEYSPTHWMKLPPPPKEI